MKLSIRDPDAVTSVRFRRIPGGRGAEGLRQALKVLGGEKVKKKLVLGTETITKENAGEILKRNGLM